MRTTIKVYKTKTGFGAYPEISALARRAFPGADVSVIAALTGDDYTVTVNNQEMFKGTAAEVRACLNQKLGGN